MEKFAFTDDYMLFVFIDPEIKKTVVEDKATALKKISEKVKVWASRNADRVAEMIEKHEGKLSLLTALLTVVFGSAVASFIIAKIGAGPLIAALATIGLGIGPALRGRM